VQLPILLEAFNGGDLLSGSEADRGAARADWFAIEQNRTGSALTFPATIFGSGQVQFIAQDG
jgi:hypothetical protein